MLTSNRRLRAALLILSALPLASFPLSAQDVTFAPSEATAPRFGFSVALSGNTAVVTTMGEVGGSEDTFPAYVYINDGFGWSEQAQLFASDGYKTDGFGFSASIDDDTVVVGAPYDDHSGGVQAGSAYVFIRTGPAWSEQAKLVATDARFYDRFGSSVAVFGDTILVGAPEDDGPTGFNAGSGYVFVRSGTTWAQQAKLSPTDALDDDKLGTSVAVSGDTAVLGAPGAGNWGAAHIFVRSGSLWTRQARLDGVGGSSVAISGDTAVFGSPGGGCIDPGLCVGEACIFSRIGSSWTPHAYLRASDAQDDDSFGSSVAISGGTALIGASGDDNYSQGAGAAYVFVKSGSVWTQTEKLVTENSGGGLGSSVAVQGGRALAGAIGGTPNAPWGASFLWSLPATAAPPAAAFTGSPLHGKAPLTVNFTDASTGEITGWLWNFGNGYFSSAQHPTFTFQEPGIYDISLTVSGSDGADFHMELGFLEVLPRSPWARQASSP